MAKDMAALVAQNTHKGKSNGRAKAYAHASEWPQCSHAGCPLPTTNKAMTVTCGYHYREHGHNAECITEAIKENITFIHKYSEMIFWNARQWNERKAELLGSIVLPATEKEIQLPSLYLDKFKKWMDNKIKVRAEEIYQGL